MENNFTHRFYQLFAQLRKGRRVIEAAVFLLAMFAISLYLRAAIVPIPIQDLTITADKAVGGPNASYTPLNAIVIREGDNKDFNNGSFTLTAPTGWRFNASGAVTATSTPTTNTNLTVTSINKAANGSTITINFTINNAASNSINDAITVSGVEVQSTDNTVITPANSPSLVRLSSSLTGIGLPATVANLRQTFGVPAKLVFSTQPVGNVLTGVALPTQPSVLIQDFLNRTITTGAGSNITVTLAIANNPTAGILAPSPATATAVNGVATFTGVNITNAGGTGFTLVASSGALTPTPPSNPFDIINRFPTLSSLTPICKSQEDPSQFTATLTGTNFVPGAMVRVYSVNFNVSYNFSPSSLNANTLQVNVDLSVFAGGFQNIPAVAVGNYTVEVVNPAPVEAGTPSTRMFTVYPVLNANSISGPTTSVCAGAAATFTAPTGFTNYTWSIPASEGSVTAGQGTNQATVTFTATAASPATVSLSATNGCGKVSNTTYNITIDAAPTASITAPNGNQSCNLVRLEATPVSGATYEWLLNGNVVPDNSNNPTYDALTSGNYSVRVTQNNCPATSNTIAVIIIAPGNIILNGPTARYCQNEDVTLLALTGTNYAYQWLQGGIIIPGANSASLTVNTPGDYSVILTTPDGCITTSSVTQVSETPLITQNTISMPPVPICVSGDPAIITGSTPGGGLGTGTYAYQWQSRPASNPVFSNIPGATSRDYDPGTITETTFYQRIVTSGSCADISPALEIKVNPAIAGNTLNTPSSTTICPNTAPGTITGNQPTGGGGPGTYTYQWQSSLNGTNFTDITGALGADYTPGNLTQTTYFRRVAASGGCISTSLAVQITVTQNPALAAIMGNNAVCVGATTLFNHATTGGTWSSNNTAVATVNATSGVVTGVSAGTAAISYTVTQNNCPNTTTKNITVNPLPTAPTISGLTANQTVYTGGNPITLNGSPTTGGTFTITDIATGATNTTGLSSTVNGVATFSPCTTGLNPGSKRITYTYSSGNCTNSASVTFTLVPSTYSVIVISNPKPFCRGENVDHTAYVYRDAVIEYPYLVNANGQPVRADMVTLIGVNELPVANPNFSLTQGAPQVIKDNAFRYYDPIVTGGTEITSGITYQWGKNQANSIGNDQKVFSNAGLSSLEYYASLVTVTSAANTCGPNFTRLSTRAYTGALPDYEIVLNASPNPICPGTPITFTAQLDADFAYWNSIGLDLNWVLTRNGARTILNTVTDYNGSNPGSLQFTTTGPNGGNFVNGDRVAIEFSSDINQFYGTSKCSGELTSVPVTITVYPPTAITTPPAPQVVCEGQNTSFSVVAAGNNLQYQWFKNNNVIPGATSATLNIINAQLTDNNTQYYVRVTGTCAPTQVFSSPVSLTVNRAYTNALRQPDPITEPQETVYFQPATYTANPANTDLAWTYNWTIIYSNARVTNPTDNNKDAVFNLTAQEMNLNFLGVEVVQVAPDGVPCVARFSAPAGSINTPQPVELLYLKATKQANQVVELEWATAMEQNSEGFEVQVSGDAKNYRALGFVAAKAGGNTNQKQVYTFHDKESGKYGTRYYRLLQRDMNGDTEYFGPKAVQFSEVAGSLVAYPNPFTNAVNLTVNAVQAGSMHVIMTNAIGAKVLERTLKIEKGSNQQKLLVNEDLPQGVYHLTTRLNGQVQHLKLLKQK